MINEKDIKIDDIELYEFFKEFSCKHFNIRYAHDKHCWNIQSGHTSVEISREDLVKLESQLKELELKYIPVQKRKTLEYPVEKETFETK